MRHFLVFILFVTVLPLNAQKLARPRLVVSIVVDPLSSEWIHKYKEHFSDGGFLKLLNEGIEFKNARTDQFLASRPSSLAMLSTGAPASVHGIVGFSWYNRLRRDETFCTEDYRSTDFVNFNQGTRHSSHHLLVTSIGDQIKQNTLGKVISASLEPDGAILGGAHRTDGTYWFDSRSGNWTSNTRFIQKLPDWVIDFNKNNRGDNLLNSEWKLITGPNSFESAQEDSNPYEIGMFGDNTSFPYKLSRMKRNSTEGQYEVLKHTPFGNTLLADFAIAAIQNENLGSDNETDYLNLTFTGFHKIVKHYGPDSQEAADAIVRLDLEIQHILYILEDNIGKENVIVVFTATHGSSWNVDRAMSLGLPAGKFRARNAIALLNSYLSAIYGENYWIESYIDQQFYLDHSLIDQNQIPISEIQEKSARFLTQFKGIANAYTAYQFNLMNVYAPEGSIFLDAYHVKRSGDILINLQPGWIQDGEFVSDHLSTYAYDQEIPLIFWGKELKQSVINENVSLKDIASTLCEICNLPYPSGNQGQSLLHYLTQSE